MNMKIILGIVLGIVLGAMLVLAIIGLNSLRGDESAPVAVETTPPDAPAAAPEALSAVVEQTAPPAVEQPRPAPASRVVMNGRTLSAGQIEEFQAMYGVKPTAGEYWYDARSGMFGAVGMAPAGFMFPGHEFGPLSADASGGTTGVFVNGRNIPQDELMVLNVIWNTYVQPGGYWIDAYGNVGYEGSDYPVANLLVQLQAISQAGGGGAGGDNIWSSRYGAGNSNADNSAGYVSVPGHGPIGYGN